jgi:hypothetical protein
MDDVMITVFLNQVILSRDGSRSNITIDDEQRRKILLKRFCSPQCFSYLPPPTVAAAGASQQNLDCSDTKTFA